MPAPFDTFDAHYPQNPWAAVTTNQRAPWYFPQLYREYARRAVWNRFVTMSFNHNGPRATELVVQSILMPHANHDPIGVRQMWLDSKYMDSFNRKISFSRYAGKLALNRYDDLVTFWTLDGVRGLERIIREGLGYMMTHTLDKLARDAFMRSPFKIFGPTGNRTSFNDIAVGDTATRDLLQDMRLGMKERNVPSAVDEMGNLGETIFCLTSPGVLLDIRREVAEGKNDTFIETQRYSNPKAILNGEIGTMDHVRFIESNDAVLWNCGAIIAQAVIDAPVQFGDGAPDPETTTVDGVEYVGQPGATHSISVDDTTDINVRDRVTIHALRTNANGVTNGVDFRDGKLDTRRVVAKTATTLTFDRPIMEEFTTDLGAGVYGYVTKGRNIHSMTFLAGSDAVAMGVAEPPMIHTPPPSDDLGMMFRFSWEAYLGYNTFNKHAAEVAFVAGSNREVGPRFIR